MLTDLYNVLLMWKFYLKRVICIVKFYKFHFW
jgi:hypothetical protein